MKSLRVVQELKNSLDWSFDPFLYDQEKFQSINNDLPRKHFYLIDEGNKRIEGHVCFQLSEGKAISHTTAPFGGFSFHETVAIENRLFFVLEVLRLMRAEGVSSLVIHQSPLMTAMDTAFLERLELLGFTTIRQHEYQMCSLNSDFMVGLHDMERRKLKKAEEKGFLFDLAPASKLKEVLDFVTEQRSILGYDFSMNWEQLREYQKAFPAHYVGARVWDGPKLIAASVMVMEDRKMLYQFAPAHLRSYNRYSPLVYLTSGVYAWAKQQGFKWLNLGTSYVSEEKNEGLFRFKENLGAQSFIAPSLQKVITSL